MGRVGIDGFSTMNTGIYEHGFFFFFQNTSTLSYLVHMTVFWFYTCTPGLSYHVQLELDYTCYVLRMHLGSSIGKL